MMALQHKYNTQHIIVTMTIIPPFSDLYVQLLMDRPVVLVVWSGWSGLGASGVGAGLREKVQSVSTVLVGKLFGSTVVGRRAGAVRVAARLCCRSTAEATGWRWSVGDREWFIASHTSIRC